MKVIILLFLTLALSGLPFNKESSLDVYHTEAVSSYQGNAILIVDVENVRTTEGVLRMGFYLPSDNFTDEPHRSPVFSKLHMKDDVVTDTIKNITPGTYAITLLDDTNSNGKMDFTFLGMPKEGFGFSNDARPKLLKSPDFESCSFRVDPGTNRISFRVQYF